MEIAQLISLLHDIGRIKGNTFGKKHSVVGAILAKEILKSYNYRKKDIKIICKAIQYHNKKNTIDDSYSELIKDADSIAHSKEEIGFEGRIYENIRVELSDCLKPVFKINDETNINEVISTYWKDIKSFISVLTKEEVNSHIVHEIRKKIRKLRSVLWILKGELDFETESKIYQLDKYLKKIFYYFEVPRALTVFCDDMQNIFEDKETIQKFNYAFISTCEILKSKILKLINKERYIKVDEMVNNLSTIKLSENNFKKINQYCEIVLKANIDDIASLHRLRIASKRIRYLIELDIILVNETIYYKQILNMHNEIGKVNDIYENIYITNSEDKMYLLLTKSEKKVINAYYEALKKEKLKTLEISLFMTKKLFGC